jgi:ATP-binding cassette subfamily B multidrug efflux pump
MMDVTDGAILVDGQDIKSINTQELKRQVGYAPQDVFLFSDTIANNISFGLTADTPNLQLLITHAANNAALSSTIDAFPLGFDTVVGERGITLSGGQKQRVSIARALIKDPEILIFDDCLSAVDNKTESEILENLKRVMNHKTVFMISHRVSSLKEVNHVIVLDQGTIVESGNHKELMEIEGRYAEIYQSQLMEEVSQNEKI